MSSATINVDIKTGAITHKRAPKQSLPKELGVVALVFVVASWVFFTGLGDFPLFNPDECFYAEPAREMLDTGDFITTTLNYAVRYTKPPLHYWATALCYYMFGSNEFAARFFSATCGAVLVAATYCMLRKFVSIRAGLIASAVLLTAPLYVVTGRLGICEMSLSFFMTGGLFCFFRAFREKRMEFAWVGYVLLACAAMTKGPVGIVLPVLILGVYHLLRRNFIEAIKFYKPHWGALLAMALALPWYVVETIVTKGEYFTCFIVMENFQRFTNVVSGHKGVWWYHIAVVAGGLFPWTIFMPQALYGALKIEQPEVHIVDESRFKFLNVFKNLDARQDMALFAACLLVITIAFFSASVSKLMSYTVPAFPALAMVIAIEIDRAINDSKLKRILIPLAILATVYGVGIFVEPMVLGMIKRAPQGIADIVSHYLTIQFAAFAAAIGLIAFGKRSLGVGVVATVTIFTTAFFGYQGISKYSDQRERGLPEIAYFAAQSDEPIFVYKARLPATTFYTHRPTVLSPTQERPIDGTNRYTGVAGQSQPPKIKFLQHDKSANDSAPKTVPAYDFVTGEEVQQAVMSGPRAYIISKKTDAPDFANRPGFKQVAESGSFALIHWINPHAAW